MSDEPTPTSSSAGCFGVLVVAGLLLMFVYPPLGAALCAVALVIAAIGSR